MRDVVKASLLCGVGLFIRSFVSVFLIGLGVLALGKLVGLPVPDWSWGGLSVFAAVVSLLIEVFVVALLYFGAKIKED